MKYLVMGTAVPFINLKDFVEEFGSVAPKALTDLMSGIRDDIRDSWHSPGNRFQPFGFTKALYQFTSSALTNRGHAPVAALVDLGAASFSPVLAFITRIWDSVVDPHLMTLEPRGDTLRITSWNAEFLGKRRL